MSGRIVAKTATDPVSTSLERQVDLPAALRVLLASIVLAGGLIFLLIGVLVLVAVAQQQILHPVGAAGLAVGSIAFAGIVLHVGWRILQARSVGLYVRRAFALMFGVGAVGMLMQAWTSDSIALAAQAILSAFCAFLFVRAGGRR